MSCQIVRLGQIFTEIKFKIWEFNKWIKSFRMLKNLSEMNKTSSLSLKRKLRLLICSLFNSQRRFLLICLKKKLQKQKQTCKLLKVKCFNRIPLLLSQMSLKPLWNLAGKMLHHPVSHTLQLITRTIYKKILFQM